MENIIKKRKKTKKGFLEKDWPQSFLEKIECPLCHSELFKKLYPKSYNRIVKCISCNLIYTNPRLKKKYLKHLYSEEYFNNNNSTHFGYENYLADEEKIVKTFEQRVKKIEKYIKREKLLDIGCATGFFMKAASSRGWKVEGVEISEFAGEYAKSHFKFKVHTQDFLTLELKPNSYDLLTFWDVIEHFYTPIAAVKKASKLLKKNGLLVISTPDVGSIPARATRNKWVGYKLSDEHLTYFSKKTITKLLEENGFSIVKKTYIGKHVSILMLADRAAIYNFLLGRLIKMLTIFFPEKYFLYVNPFDIMCIYARKK